MSKSGIFVDTSIWIGFLNSRHHEQLIKQGIDENTLYYCGIVLIELLQGAPDSREAEELSVLLKGLNRLEITAEIEEECAMLQFSLRKKGKIIPVTDALIGTLCLHHNLELITLDKHFKMIPGLKLVRV